MLDPKGKEAAASNRGGERRYGLVGATAAGRVLYVVYTERSGDIRVVTAFDANAGQKRRYRQR